MSELEYEYIKVIIRANKLLTSQQKNIHLYCINFTKQVLDEIISDIKPVNKNFAKYIGVHKDELHLNVLKICNISHEPHYYSYVLSKYPPELFQDTEMIQLANSQIDKLENNFQNRISDITNNIYIATYGLFLQMFKSNSTIDYDIKKCRVKYLDDTNTYDIFCNHILTKIKQTTKITT